MNMHTAPKRVHIGLIMLALCGALQMAGDQDQKSEQTPTPPLLSLPADDGSANILWLDKIDAAERTVLNSKVNEFIVAPPKTVQWFGGAAPTNFKKCVTVIQSASDKSNGINAALKIKKNLPKDVKFVVVYLPQNIEKSKKQFENKPPCQIALDPDGAWTALLGLPKKPTNMVVDKNGIVRFVGLNAEGLKYASEFLLAEPAEETEPVTAPVVGKPVATSATATTFPTFTNALSSCKDQRGKKMPPFTVQTWLTKQPKMDKKLLVIDFWATWCGPCRASIPHMNDMAKKFSADVVCVGISDESKSALDAGMTKTNLKLSSFNYSLAIDPNHTLYSFFEVKGIPSCAIISSDGIVRWQGHPMSLDDATMTQLVAAQKALNASAKKK